MATWDSTGRYMSEKPLGQAHLQEGPMNYAGMGRGYAGITDPDRLMAPRGESLAMSAALDNQAQSSLDEREVLAKFGGWQNYNAWWNSLPQEQRPTNYAQVKAMIGEGPAPSGTPAPPVAAPAQATAAAAMPPVTPAVASPGGGGERARVSQADVTSALMGAGYPNETTIDTPPPTAPGRGGRISFSPLNITDAGPFGSAMSGMAGTLGAAGSVAGGLGAAARGAVPSPGGAYSMDLSGSPANIQPSPGVDGTWPAGAPWEGSRLAQPDGTWPMGAGYQDPMPKAGDGSWPQMQAPVPSHPMDLSGSPATIQPLTAGDGTWPMGAPWEDKRLAQPDGSWPMGAGNPMQGAGMGPLEYQHPMSPGLGMGALRPMEPMAHGVPEAGTKTFDWSSKPSTNPLQFEDLAMAENPVTMQDMVPLQQPQDEVIPKILAEQTAPGQMSMLPGGAYSREAAPAPSPLFPPFPQQPQEAGGGGVQYVAGQPFTPGMFPGAPAPQMGGGVDGTWPMGAAMPQPQVQPQSGGYAPYVAGQQFNPQMFNQPPVPPGGFYPPSPAQGLQYPPFPQGDSFTRKDASRRFQTAAAKLNK